MQYIGTRLKNAIKNSNFTQKEIAVIIETTEKTLSSYTQNKSSIPVDVLVKICNVINTPINEIIYGIDKDNFDEMILSKLRKLTDEQKKEIIGHIEFLESKNQKSYTYTVAEKKEDLKDDTG